MKKLLPKKLMLFVGLLFCASSCIDDSYDMDNVSTDVYLDYEAYLPLAHTKVTVADLIDKIHDDVEELEIREDGLLYFVYDTTTVYTLEPFKIKAKEVTYKKTLDVAFPGYDPNLIPEGMSVPGIKAGEVISFPVDVNLELGEEIGTGRIDSIAVRKAAFCFKIGSSTIADFGKKVKLVIDIPEGVIKGGFANKCVWDAAKGETSLVLDGSTVCLNSDKLHLDCKFVVLEDIPLTGAASGINLSLLSKETEIEYKTIYGAFKAVEPQKDYVELGIDIFHEKKAKFDLSVIDPRIEMEVSSNCGIPLQTEITSLRSKNMEGKVVNGIFRDGTPSYKTDFDYSKVENTKVKAFADVFDKENGSLDKLFNNHPDSILLDCSYTINGSLENNVSYFLQDTTVIETHIKAEVPFWLGNNSYVEVKDTIDDINIEKDVEDYQKEDYSIEVAEIFFEFENSLPLDAFVSAKFIKVDTVVVNGEKQIVKSLIDPVGLDQEIKLNPAVVDQNTARVISSSFIKKSIKVVGEQAEDLKKIREIALTYKVSIPEGKNGVKLSDDCYLSAKAYAHAKANITIKND